MVKLPSIVVPPVGAASNVIVVPAAYPLPPSTIVIPLLESPP